MSIVRLCKSWAIATVLSLIAATVCAQDLVDVWQLAIKHDPAYAASQAYRTAEQEAVPQARAQLLPYISASVGVEATEVRKRSGLRSELSQQRGLWALSLSQPIINLGAWNQLQQADLVAKAADVIQAQA